MFSLLNRTVGYTCSFLKPGMQNCLPLAGCHTASYHVTDAEGEVWKFQAMAGTDQKEHRPEN